MNLSDFSSLTDEIVAKLSHDLLRPVTLHLGATNLSQKLTSNEQRDLERLITEAVTKGISFRSTPSYSLNYSSAGNTARAVAFVQLPLSIVIKISNSREIIDEARIVEDFKSSEDLPLAWRDAFPQVFSTMEGKHIFAYAMEHFEDYDTLAEAIATNERKRQRITDILSSVISLLFEVYENQSEAKESVLRPNIAFLYIDRIAERLLHPKIRPNGRVAKALDVPWHVNGRVHESPLSLVRWLEENRNRIDAQVGPRFCSVVHGDSHPKNILVSRDGHFRIRMIDPKAWGRGDYLFDIVKLNQFFSFVNAHRREDGISVTKLRIADEFLEVAYKVKQKSWEKDAVKQILSRTSKFAAQGDSHWEIRYKLAMASMLLGITQKQSDSEEETAKSVRMAEGLRYLSEFKQLFVSEFDSESTE